MHPTSARRAPSNSAQASSRSISITGMLYDDLLSFEMVFMLYLFSNVFQFILPTMPVDLTYVWLAMSVIFGLSIILNSGIYLPGLTLVSSCLPWLLWTNASVLWTPSVTQAWTYLKIVNFVNVWCLIVGAMIISQKRERMLRFLKLMIIFSVVVAAIGVFIYLRYGSFKFAGWAGQGRVYNSWGRSVANGAVIMTVIFFRSHLFTLRQAVTSGLLGLCVLFVLISSSRSALLSVITPCIFYWFIVLLPLGRKGIKMMQGALLMPIILLCVSASIVILVYSGRHIDTIARMRQVVVQSNDPDMVTGANRWAYYSAAVKLIFRSPINGHGVRSFAPLYKHNEVEGTQPHNIFLEILSDTGVIGFLLFLLFLYIAVRPLQLQRLRTDPMLLTVAMLFVSRFTAVQFGEDISGQQEIFVFIGLLALCPSSVGIGAPSSGPVSTRVGEDRDGVDTDAGRPEGAPSNCRPLGLRRPSCQRR